MAEEKKDNTNSQKQGKQENTPPPGGGNKMPTDPNKKPKFNIYWVYGLIALVFLGLQFLSFTPDPKTINRSEFKKMLDNKHIRQILVVNREKAEIFLNSAGISQHKSKMNDGAAQTEGPHFIYTISSVEVFEQRLEEAQKKYSASEDRIDVRYETRRDILGDILGWLLPIIILVAVWIFIFRRMGGLGGGGGGAGNIFNIGKSKAKIFDKEEANVKINFNDVAGLEEAKIEVMEIVDFLKTPEKYTDLGGKIPKGALLVGPPGTGKTLLAKAVAGEAHVPFFSMSGSDFVEMFVGVGASRVRDLFAQAKSKAPCIVFIDEIDAIGRARGKNPNMGSNDERENTLNQLLTEMDGFDTNSGVIILAATNRADILDRALLRAGRFDRQIHVELPDLKERRKIFDVHTKPLKMSEGLELEFLAQQTPGFSGADIANVCNEAALIAARKNKKIVEKQDFLDAIDRFIGGLEKKNKIITPEEKKTIAYHEAGHATVSWLLKHSNPLIKVTIIPRGKALGAAWYLPEERQLTTTDQLLDEMCAVLGGRASEEVNFGKLSTGALNDLERATKQAYAMVIYYGMSPKLGNLSYFDSSGQSEYSFNKPYSEKTAEIIDKEVEKIIETQYKRAKEVLIKNIGGLSQLADLLLEREVIFTKDLENIFGKREEAIKNEFNPQKEETF